MDLGGALFLFFFFSMFWSQKPRSWFYLIGILVLGLLSHHQWRVGDFFIYAAAFSPFLSETEKGALKFMH